MKCDGVVAEVDRNRKERRQKRKKERKKND